MPQKDYSVVWRNSDTVAAAAADDDNHAGEVYYYYETSIKQHDLAFLSTLNFTT
jgi:hypothetical protein